MSKPSPYCECHKWDQPGGICAYCVGYTDGWTTETEALRRERDALQAVVDAVAAFTAQDFALSGAHGIMRLVRMAKNAKAAAKGVG